MFCFSDLLAPPGWFSVFLREKLAASFFGSGGARFRVMDF